MELLDLQLENRVIQIFKHIKNNYGTRKIKVVLESYNIVASRPKICFIIKK